MKETRECLHAIGSNLVEREGEKPWSDCLIGEKRWDVEDKWSIWPFFGEFCIFFSSLISHLQEEYVTAEYVTM